MRDTMLEIFDSLQSPNERAKQLSGRVLDGYKLEEVLDRGVGGHGVVYRARHPQMGVVAVKVLAVDIESQPDAYQRFQREIDILIKLSDAPNVVDIRHAGTVDGMPWYAMELVDGEPLSDWMSTRHATKQPIEEREVRQIVLAILKGLEQMQEAFEDLQGGTRHVVHRDLKPSNVMVFRSGGELCIRLIDFGIARLFELQVSATASLTVDGSSPMTPQYVSPEMLVAGRQLDSRSDLFQVGLIAYELVTGRRYWSESQPLEQLHKSRHFSRSMLLAIQRSLNWDPGNRFSSAAKFRKELEHPRRTLAIRLWRILMPLVAVFLISVSALGWHAATRDRNRAESELSGSQREARRIADRLGAAERRLRVLEKGDSPYAVLEDIRQRYRRLTEGRADRQTLHELASRCDEYLANSGADAIQSDVRALRDWLRQALSPSAKVRLIPARFNEHETDLWDSHPMRYEFKTMSAASKPVGGEEWVNKQKDLGGWPELTVPWDPAERVQVLVSETKKNLSGKTIIALSGESVLKASGDDWLQLKTDADPDFIFYFRVARDSFGALPPSP